MEKNNQGEHHSQSFMTGFLLGGIVASVGFYLTMTKSGRRVAKELLKAAEEVGERGEEYLTEIAESPAVKEVKKEAGEKLTGIIGKLKSELKAATKSVDS